MAIFPHFRFNKVISCLAIFMMISGCKEEFQLPEVTTAEISSPAGSILIAGGTVLNDGGTQVVERGICWNETGMPTTSHLKSIAGSGTGGFTTTIEDLQVNRLYYFRAYATSEAGTAYGNQVSYFLPPSEPLIVITGVSLIRYNSVVLQGYLRYDNGIILYSAGICYSTSPNPTVANSIVPAKITGNNFTVEHATLAGNTLYYFVPYMIFRFYGGGTYYVIYGKEDSFVTDPSPPTVTTDTVFSVSATAATIEGSVVSNGGAPTIIRGVCLDVNDAPTIDNAVFHVDGDEGTFSVSIEGLEPGTIYYVRAFATNSTGTEYGWTIKFGTDHPPITDLSDNSYAVVNMGDQFWLGENLKTTRYNDNTEIPLGQSIEEWLVAAPAYCWDKNNVNSTYGILYNGYAVNTGKLCPSGWHVPSSSDWTKLFQFYGGNTAAAKQLRETGDSRAFAALPGGYRDRYGNFQSVGQDGFWWISTTVSITGIEYLTYWYLTYWSEVISFGTTTQNTGGLSVRCIKD